MKDLHLHTKYSDGEDDEYEIINKILESNVREFAICDHDTLEGSKKVSAIVNNYPELKFHPGVELSCRVFDYNNGINIHLLVHDFDYNDKTLLSFVQEANALRLKKIAKMVDNVKELYGITIPQKRIDEMLKQTHSFGKPHIYRLLCEQGCFDREEFYQKMNKFKYKEFRLNAIDVISKLQNHKGYVTLAHPIEIMEEYNMSYNDIDKLVYYLVKFGLKGLEVKHSKQTYNDYVIFSEIAKKYNLVGTFGSDYHGPHVKPNLKIGDLEKDN